MHVLITGGAGFIGSHLADLHLHRGDSVHVVDDLSTGRLENLAGFRDRTNFHFDEADVLTWDGLATAVAWADRVYHLAAVVGMYRVLEEPVKVLATNVAGTERLLRAVHDGGWRPQVVVASSSEVYGPQNPSSGRLTETSDLLIRSGAVIRWNYAVSKLADEALALSYARHFDLPVCIVRLFNTVGPRQTGRYGMVVPRFVAQAVAGEPITVYGDGTQSRCFCDVRDTARALDLLAVDPRSQGEIFNVGHDEPITIGALAQRVRERACGSSEIRVIPYAEAYSTGYEDIHHRRPDLAKLRSRVAWRPEHSLNDTLDLLIADRRLATLTAESVAVADAVSGQTAEPAGEGAASWRPHRTSSSAQTPS